MSEMQDIIEKAFDNRADITPRNVDTLVRDAVMETIDQIDRGELRVAEKKEGEWIVNEWAKKAVLLSFRIHANEVIDAGYTQFFDKLPLRWGSEFGERIEETGARVVPPATVRRAASKSPEASFCRAFLSTLSRERPLKYSPRRDTYTISRTDDPEADQWHIGQPRVLGEAFCPERLHNR